ncbi:hypothetical protein KY307_02070 [Candidatus Woesearchaeota archaeon]|nr:hypothetical protein [Candidatus Woesearchaeota archaeon]
MEVCLLIYKPISRERFSMILNKLSTVIDKQRLEILCIPWSRFTLNSMKDIKEIAYNHGILLGYIPAQPYDQTKNALPLKSLSRAFETTAIYGHRIRILQEDLEKIIEKTNLTYNDLKSISRNYDFPLVMGKNDQFHFPFMWAVMYSVPPEETQKKSNAEFLYSAATQSIQEDYK